MISLISSSMV